MGEAMNGVLELRDVTRVHGAGEVAVHALRGISLIVNAGELVAAPASPHCSTSPAASTRPRAARSSSRACRWPD